jgi:predicted HAD superfamily hydrolase
MKCLIEEKKMLSDITKCNYELLNEIKRIKSQGNYVILLSDFYLGKDVVGDLLTNKLGEDAFNLFDEIVVSCDINANKSSGSSYQYILNKYKILPKNCLMTGDNILSDFIMAKKYGLKARLWRKHEKKF